MIRISFLLFLAMCISLEGMAQQEGRSGTIKVRKPGAQRYFIDLEEPQECLNSSSKEPVPTFAIDAGSCPVEPGLIWVKLIINTKGRVENLKPADPGMESCILESARAFALRALRFEPHVLDNQPVPCRFEFPLRHYQI